VSSRFHVNVADPQIEGLGDPASSVQQKEDKQMQATLVEVS